MAITFYLGSGSPFAWKVWLTLEHKVLPYELRVVALGKGEHYGEAYLRMNPRGRVPVLVDGDVTLAESSAIVAYLEEVYPARPVLPAAPAERARQRRLEAEATFNLFPAARALLGLTIQRSGAPAPEAELEAPRAALLAELGHFERDLRGDGFGEDGPGLGDYAILPMLALIRRIDERYPGKGIWADCPSSLVRYVAHHEKLPIFQTTWPPHWA